MEPLIAQKMLHLLEKVEILDMRFRKISACVNYSRNRNPWFGLMFKFGQFQGDDAYIFIERGDEDVYYGLTMIKSGISEYNHEPKFQPLVKLVAAFSEWENSQHWIGVAIASRK